MKEKFLKFIKWFFIVLGILFFILLILLSGIIIAFNRMGDFSIKTPKFENRFHGDMAKLIKYVKDYKEKNGNYPENIEGVNIKKDLNYEYKVFENGNCFSIDLNENNTQKQYKYCANGSDDSTFNGESYSEYTK